MQIVELLNNSEAKNKILIPDPLDSDRQFERFHHFDIPNLDDTEIINELHALYPLLWWGLPNDCWLHERVKALNMESYKRRVDTRFGFRGTPKPALSQGVKL